MSNLLFYAPVLLYLSIGSACHECPTVVIYGSHKLRVLGVLENKRKCTIQGLRFGMGLLL